VNSLPKTVTRQRRGCDLNPGLSAPESSTLTTRLPSHPIADSAYALTSCALYCGRSLLSTTVVILHSAHGVSFYNPQLADTCWNECFIAHEVAMKEACRLLFFVITEDTRAVTSMLEVVIL